MFSHDNSCDTYKVAALHSDSNKTMEVQVLSLSNNI